MSGKCRKVSVLLGEQEFAQLDKICALRGYKKSTLMVRLLREFIAANPLPSDDATANTKMHARKKK